MCVCGWSLSVSGIAEKCMEKADVDAAYCEVGGSYFCVCVCMGMCVCV